MPRFVSQKILVTFLLALSTSFAAEQPKLDLVKRIAPEYLGKYTKVGVKSTAPDCEIKELAINIAGFGEYQMISLFRITPITGKDFYSAYLDDPKETWITLHKLNDDTLEVRFMQKITKKIIRSETYLRIK
jgi:hypothetical protein